MRFFSTSALWLRCQITYTPLILDTYNLSRCNALHSLNTGNKEHRHKSSGEYIYRWAHHRQRSGDCRSYSNVGSTIKCGVHCINETPWYKTHPGQAWSVHKLERALQRFFSTDRRMLHQTRKDRNWWRDQMLSEVNLHESSRRISDCLATLTWKSKCSPGKQKKHTSTVWHPFTRKLQRNNKAHPVHLASQKSAITELGNDGGIRLTWNSKQQKNRQGKNSQLWPGRLSNLMVTT